MDVLEIETATHTTTEIAPNPVESYENDEVHPFNPRDLIIIAGSAYPSLAHAVAQLLQTEFSQSTSRFGNGETRVQIKPNLRKREVVIIQPTVPPDQDRYFVEIFLLADAARRASAGDITAILPFASYQRQDRKESPRVPISASVMPKLLIAAGVHRLMTIDNHSPQQQGYIENPWDELYASYSLVPEIQALGLDNPLVLSPDVGGMKRADYYLHVLGFKDIGVVYKRRSKTNSHTETAMLVGDVMERDVLLVDDMIDGGGTILGAAKMAKEMGARRVVVAVAHGLFSGNFIAKLNDSPVELILVTNTLPHRPEILEHPKIKVVDVSPLIAEAVKRTTTGQSLSDLFPAMEITV